MIHYIVAVWLGPRRVQPISNPYAYLRHQLYFLKNSESIDKTTFVVNQYDIELEKEIEPIIASFGVRASVIYRENLGCSYAAFQEAVIQNLEYDYHFLTEDDGKPTDDNFLIPYLREMKDDTIFVAFGSGLLSGKFAKKIYSERGILFNLRNSTSYEDCEWNQIHFLDYLKEMGEIRNASGCSLLYQDDLKFPNPHGDALWATGKFRLISPRWATIGKYSPIMPISALQTLHKLI